MKTSTFFTRLIYLILLSFLISTNYGCKAMFDAELNGEQTIPFTKEGLLDLNKLSEWVEADQEPELIAYHYPTQFVAASGGFGLNSSEGESETSFCLGGEYNYRISEDNYNGASYVGAAVSHHISNADEYKFNRTSFGLQYTYFDRITKNAELDLTYGLKANYEIGNLENFGFEEDFNGYGASLIFGANFNVNDKIAVGVTVPFLSYSQRTYEYEDNEREISNTWLGLNKDNMVMAYARIGLGK
ncbi:hypothetical protein [Psychroserpens jangbogonensis]|uniref:hypothetical protein n=1 Tax=Psychroserpens jangbogonensis TaxID=1484460 RepID=UPI00126A5F54|nr:hypothetical protein [Psychroserpens jangbogonensis]